MASGSVAVSLSDVTYRIGDQKLVAGLSLKIEDGETLVLLGRSGSGKTTTLKLINGLLAPTSGSVVVEGIQTDQWDPIRLRRRIGYVIQEVGLFPHLTVGQNVGVVPSLEGWKKEAIRDRVRELLTLVGLKPAKYLDRYPAELSGGQRQRVGVARALAADPPILLMDEPFGALDPLTRSGIQREFRGLQERLKKTVVLVTHDIREAFLLASRVGLLESGQLVELRTPSDFEKSRVPEARDFIESLKTTHHSFQAGER